MATRIIRVRNASIVASLHGHEIDFEIRTTKDSAQGLGLFIDGVKIIDFDCKSNQGTFKDGCNEYPDDVLFKLSEKNSNGCVSHFYYKKDGKRGERRIVLQ